MCYCYCTTRLQLPHSASTCHFSPPPFTSRFSSTTSHLPPSVSSPPSSFSSLHLPPRAHPPLFHPRDTLCQIMSDLGLLATPRDTCSVGSFYHMVQGYDSGCVGGQLLMLLPPCCITAMQLTPGPITNPEAHATWESRTVSLVSVTLTPGVGQVLRLRLERSLR